MHFRSFIIPALMAGAALFLPNQASAEKPEPSEQASSHLVEAQSSLKKAENVVTKVDVPSKPQQAKPTVEKKPEVTVPSSKAQTPAVQRGLKQAVTKKTTAVPKSLPAQAKGNGNGNGHSAIKQNEKPAVVPTVQVKKSEPEAKKASTPTDAEVVKRTTVPNEPVPVEFKAKKFERMEPVVPVKPDKDKVPAEKEELPTVDQTLNQTQRSSGLGGGQSNDRVSQSLHTISFLEKWFEWNKDYEIKLVQPFLSRYALKHHQWVNAPPAPPPQTAPFYKTVTRS
ncbi:hypothetical protein [Bacillus sp. AFS037270]|uniref:hypothetical protein n=1 Tax=Bacillus sp. AFS037270 TaxID=2033499 RepID=UPI000BFE1E75|nr:hypothetical protein [Bacillus sp. AFS037270]PGV53568.1 hypothetical protein COD92_08310 [Bacillus sp. AFS037270]